MQKSSGSFKLFNKKMGSSTHFLFFFFLFTKSVESTGYMSTIATSGAPWDPASNSAVCILENKTLIPSCAGYSDLNLLNHPNQRMLAISGGHYFFCGLIYDSGKPACWGQNATSGVEIPEDYNATEYISLNTGATHVCAIRKDNSVNCWGGGGADLNTSVSLIAITSGNQFSCGLKENSKVYCWGPGSSNLSKYEDMNFDSIFAGTYHVCGIESQTGKAICWGENESGQCNAPGNIRFSALSAGRSHTCGLRKNNEEIFCWGLLNNSVVPPGKFSVISAAANYSCAVEKNTSSVKCWGSSRSDYPSSANQALCAQQCQSDQHLQECKLNQQCPKSSDKLCLQYTSCENQTYIQPASGPSSSSKHSISKALIIGLVIAGIFVILCFSGIVFFCLRPIRAKSKQNWMLEANRVIKFTGSELRSACNCFSEEMILGKGAYGMVYKGILANGECVAIKKVIHLKSLASLTTELRLLARVHHVNLVNLVGYCEDEGLLVYEFMENGSLYDCLFSKKPGTNLNWHTRIKIAAQAARGLEYLHKYASPRIVHRDVKSSNILIDAAWNAHVSDFGLSVLLPPPNLDDQSGHLTDMPVAGTLGYLDPEYFKTRELTVKSDVYSFGVVLLEILTGLKAVIVEENVVSGLVEWINERLKEDENRIDMLDQSLELTDPEPMLKAMEVGLKCVRKKGKERPSMSYVASRLEEALSDLQRWTSGLPPEQETQSLSSSSSFVGISSSSMISSYGAI